MEIWKTIPGERFVGYEASNLGRIRRAETGKVLKPRICEQKSGITWQVSPCVNGVAKNATVHTLVMLAFEGPCPIGMEINHIDGDRANNSHENLEYVTHKKNQEHMVAMGRSPRGARNGMTSLTAEQVAEIRQLVANGSKQRPLAKIYGVSVQTICNIVHRKTWSHEPICHSPRIA